MEDKLKILLEELDANVFISETDSVTGKVTELDSKVEDREGTIYIHGEWDREDLKKILSKVFASPHSNE